MIKKYIYSIIIGACSLSLSGCGNDAIVQEDVAGQTLPISFKANLPSLNIENTTRATSFSNGDRVTIVAANAGAESPIPTDWTPGNLYLNHEVGTIGSETWEHEYAEYPITLNTLKYWYFEPNKYLSFIAYSPITDPEVDARVSRTDMNLAINGTTEPLFPDLLYTAPIGNYNKSRVSVLLDFKHAMARLAVKVIAVDQDNNILPANEHPVNQLQISSLVIKTKVTQGNFNLVSSQWTLTDPGSSAPSQVAYTVIPSSGASTSIPYDNSGTGIGTSTSYLLPSASNVNTVELSSIVFKVKDTNTDIEVGGEYTLNQFKQIDNSPVTLEMGKTTILLIKLQYTAIPPITPTVQLQGQLVDWNDKGASTVTIE